MIQFGASLPILGPLLSSTSTTLETLFITRNGFVCDRFDREAAEPLGM